MRRRAKAGDWAAAPTKIDESVSQWDARECEGNFMSTNINEQFCERLRDFDTAVLITKGPKNEFCARPMAIAGVDDNCDLWFLTSKDSVKVHQIEKNTHVDLVCQHGWSSCICATGKASVEQDAAMIEQLWNSAYQVWFPRGVNDPDIALIHVVLEKGEYWDNTGLNRFNYVYQTIKAIVTGKKPEVEEGKQHGKVKLD
jgi:general stress protein 26